MKNLLSVTLSNKAVNCTIDLGTSKSEVANLVASQIEIAPGKINIPESTYKDLELLSNFFQSIKC